MPDLALPAVNRDGTVALADYRGRSPLLIGLMRGLHCPFCRRQIHQLDSIHDALAAAGVESVIIVNTTLGRARLYFGYRQVRSLLLADPDAASHRAFGVPEADTTAEAFARVRVNPTGELPAPLPPLEANAALNRRDGFELTPDDDAIFARHGAQLAAHFLVDREGVVRRRWAEGERSLDDIGRFPSNAEFLAAARELR